MMPPIWQRQFTYGKRWPIVHLLLLLYVATNRYYMRPQPKVYPLKTHSTMPTLTDNHKSYPLIS
jgi:hypothetical protein